MNRSFEDDLDKALTHNRQLEAMYEATQQTLQYKTESLEDAEQTIEQLNNKIEELEEYIMENCKDGRESG